MACAHRTAMLESRWSLTAPPRSSKQKMRSDTILVIPFADGIGDFINVQPLLAALRRRFPDAAFTVAAAEHGNQLITDSEIEVLKSAGFHYEPGRMAYA